MTKTETCNSFLSQLFFPKALHTAICWALVILTGWFLVALVSYKILLISSCWHAGLPPLAGRVGLCGFVTIPQISPQQLFHLSYDLSFVVACSMDTQLVLRHAAWTVHAARSYPCPCCTSMSMAHFNVHVHAACPSTCCGSMSTVPE
jgi:hypothetical protein